MLILTGILIDQQLLFGHITLLKFSHLTTHESCVSLALNYLFRGQPDSLRVGKRQAARLACSAAWDISCLPVTCLPQESSLHTLFFKPESPVLVEPDKATY